jgi:hypothetical protein
VYDQTSVSENVSTAFQLIASVYDGVSVTDVPSISLGAAPDLDISVYDGITVDEEGWKQFPGEDLYVNEYESITLSESISHIGAGEIVRFVAKKRSFAYEVEERQFDFAVGTKRVKMRNSPPQSNDNQIDIDIKRS